MHHLLRMNQERGEQLKPGDVNIEMPLGGERVAKEREGLPGRHGEGGIGHGQQRCPTFSFSLAFLPFQLLGILNN